MSFLPVLSGLNFPAESSPWSSFEMIFSLCWLIFYLAGGVFLKARFIRPHQEPSGLLLQTRRPFVISNILLCLIFVNPFFVGFLLNCFLSLGGFFVFMLFYLVFLAVGVDFLVLRALPETGMPGFKKYSFSILRLIASDLVVIVLGLCASFILSYLAGDSSQSDTVPERSQTKQFFDAPADSMTWRELMNSYQSWGRSFAEEINKHKEDPIFRQKWESAGLDCLFKKETLDKLSYPVLVAEKANFVVSEYPQWKDADLSQSASGQETRNALETYTRITNIFDPSGKESWKYLSDIQGLKEIFVTWQCEVPLEQLLESVKPQNPNFISNIDALIAIYQPIIECVNAYQDLPDTMDPRLTTVLNDRIAKTLNGNFTPSAFEEIHRDILKPLKATLAIAQEAMEEKENKEAVDAILDTLVNNLSLDAPQAIRVAWAGLENMIITWDKADRYITDSKPSGEIALKLWSQWKDNFNQTKTNKINDREWLKTIKNTDYPVFLSHITASQSLFDKIQIILHNWHSTNEPVFEEQTTLFALKTSLLKECESVQGLREINDVQAVLKDTEQLSNIENVNNSIELISLLEKTSGTVKSFHRYAAWRRLGQLDEGWQWNDKQEMLRTYESLKQEVKDNITEPQRKEVILAVIETTAAGRLKKYLDKQTAGLNETLDTLKEPDESFTSLILEPCKEDIKNRIMAFHETLDGAKDASTMNTQLDTNWATIDSKSRLIISKITSLVNSENWKAVNCRKELFSRDMITDWETTKEWSSVFLENWIQKIPLYHTISDSRNDIIAKDIADRIESEAEPQEKEGIRKELDALSAEIIASQAEFPAIQKYAEDIVKQVDRFKGRYDAIEQKLTPAWCGFLTWDDTKGKIIFKNNILPDFEPVILVKGNDGDPLINKEWDVISSRENWRQIRKFPDPFFSGEGFDEKQPSWPKYIRSTKEPSVICRFIPGDNAKGLKPFYMGISEVTYTQYNIFLKSVFNVWNSRDVSKYVIKVPYKTIRDITLVYYTGWNPIDNFDVLPSLSNNPAVWVTISGAREYASWIGGRLPNTSEHRYANLYSSGGTFTGNDHLSKNTDIEQAWKKFLQAAVIERLKYSYPWGVIVRKDNPQLTTPPESGKQTVFPRFVGNALSNKGLYDLCGNVWEWCEGENGNAAICGYSSLTPEEFQTDAFYILTGLGTIDKYEYTVEPNCDVGFRIVIELSNIN